MKETFGKSDCGVKSETNRQRFTSQDGKTKSIDEEFYKNVVHFPRQVRTSDFRVFLTLYRPYFVLIIVQKRGVDLVQQPWSTSQARLDNAFGVPERLRSGEQYQVIQLPPELIAQIDEALAKTDTDPLRNRPYSDSNYTKKQRSRVRSQEGGLTNPHFCWLGAPVRRGGPD
ncbi:hypothetical protein L596_014081 [Steinernema carpocapsae]|uniref:Uncharacterized protein n=1 Tax=Steinernema carpocapsae TaxID=34508 RepID=A0A4U5NBT4_STECR|nr:hypothetical protein L596_014081 [Steinernema carpocapsae]